MVLRATKGDEDMGCFRYFFAGSYRAEGFPRPGLPLSPLHQHFT
jgi:hypothetical protein